MESIARGLVCLRIASLLLYSAWKAPERSWIVEKPLIPSENTAAVWPGYPVLRLLEF